MRRLGIGILLAVLAVVGSSAQAYASTTTIGAATTSSAGSGCDSGYAFLSAYAAPTSGTITSWSIGAPADGSTAAFKVFRLVDADTHTYTVVGTSADEPLSAGMNTFPASIEVQAGDLLGLYTVSGLVHCVNWGTGYPNPGDRGGWSETSNPGVGTNVGFNLFDLVALNIEAQLVTPGDTVPPVVNVPPAGDTENATSPAGVQLTLSFYAFDDVDGALTPWCDPASGSMFPIGTTTVTCYATDSAGNTGSASFSLHVKGAPEQIDDVLAWLQEPGRLPRGDTQSLTSKLDAAKAALARGNDNAATNVLGAALHYVDAQTDKSIGTKSARRLTTDITRIQAVIG